MSSAVGGTRRLVTVAVAAVLLGALVVRRGTLFALIPPSILAVLVLGLLVHTLVRWPDDPDGSERIMRWTMVAFVVHLVFSLIASNTPNPLAYDRTDASQYHDGAVALLNHWTSGMPAPDLPSGKEGFYYVLGLLYWVFGTHGAVGLVLNATLAAALIPIMSDLTHRLFGRQAAGYVPQLVFLLPGIFIWTSQLLKEAPILFLIAVAAYCAVRVSQRVSVLALLGMCMSVALLFTFRGPVALVATGGLLAGIILGSKQLLGGLGTGLTATTLVVMLVLTLGIGLSGYESAVESDLRRANIVRQDLATAGSGIRPGVDISTPRKALTYLPVGLVDFFLGPFPWRSLSRLQVFSLADVLVWWALLPALGRGLQAARRGRSGRRSLVLLLPAIIISFELALVIGNFGTIVRERTQVVIFLVPFIALGLAVRAATRATHTEPVPTPALAA